MAVTAELKARLPYPVWVLVRGAWSRGRADECSDIDEPECALEMSWRRVRSSLYLVCQNCQFEGCCHCRHPKSSKFQALIVQPGPFTFQPTLYISARSSSLHRLYTSWMFPLPFFIIRSPDLTISLWNELVSYETHQMAIYSGSKESIERTSIFENFKLLNSKCSTKSIWPGLAHRFSAQPKLTGLISSCGRLPLGPCTYLVHLHDWGSEAVNHVAHLCH